jgi:hypothetical protein
MHYVGALLVVAVISVLWGILFFSYIFYATGFYFLIKCCAGNELNEMKLLFGDGWCVGVRFGYIGSGWTEEMILSKI